MICTLNFLFGLLIKLYHFLLRLGNVVFNFPLRLGRLTRHVSTGISNLASADNSVPAIVFWLTETLLLILDLIGFAEVYESVADLLKFNTRPLFDWEIELGRRIYGDSILWNRVRIDEAAWLGPKQFRLCYVSGFTINSWGPMDNALFIHELMHVWQYQQVGLPYIVRALRAYHSSEKYNYGGLEALRKIKEANGNIWSFNFEQQGDIMADYYRISENRKPQWGSASLYDLPVYAYFAEQVINSK